MSSNTNIVKIPQDLTGTGYRVCTDADTGLNIITVVPNEQPDLTLQLKGLIYDPKTNKVIAPSVHIPDDLRAVSCPHDLIKQVTRCTEALDGVMIRVYKYMDKWYYSTNGKVVPTATATTKCFSDLARELIDESQLDDKYCYYFLLQSSAHCNIVLHNTSSVTLQRVVNLEDMSNMDLASFNFMVPKYQYGYEAQQTVQNVLDTVENTPAPITYVGVVAYLDDGRIYRFETADYKAAARCKGNSSDDVNQYLQLYHNNNDIDPTYRFLSYFPHKEGKFREIKTKFVAMCSKLAEDHNNKVNFYPQRHYKYQRDKLSKIKGDLTWRQVSDILITEDVPLVRFLMG